MLKHILKIHFVSILSLLYLTAATNAGETEPIYKQVTSALKKQIDSYTVPFGKWKYRADCDEKCLLPDAPQDLKWKPVAPGFYWMEPMQTFWFRKEYTVPEQIAGRNIAGSKITLYMKVSDYSEAYINGKKVGSAESGATLVESAVPGEKLTIGARVSNGTWPGAYLGAELKFSAFNSIVGKTQTYLDRIASAEMLLPFSTEKDRWTKILDVSASKVNTDALKLYDENTYFSSLDAATAELEQLSPLFKNYTLYLVGYSHIDLAWLWDKAEGEIVTRDTLNTVYQLLVEYPDWIYTHSQAHGVKWMEDDYPDVFAKLKKYFKDGRIELVGGTWSEHDSNLPSGEGFVRQFLYGKRYFREKFGKDIVIAWTPDSFGYNWNLPQILVKSGMKGFLTQKLGSNEVTQFPYTIFWWEAPDGSRVLTYFPPSGYANGVHRPEMIGHLAMIKNRHNVNENFVIFGVGNHGGGVTREQLERSVSMKNDNAYPDIVYTSAENYFNHLAELSKTVEFPTWKDELYLEHHRGTYTTQANNKKHNRRCEQLLMDAEKLSAIASTKYNATYPSKRLFDSGWYLVLFNHMHDILPGSGIHKVYEDSDKDYAEVYSETESIIKESLEKIAADVKTEGAGEPLLVFNTLSWTRDAIVEEPFDGLTPDAEVVDHEGNTIISQVTNKNGAPHILFVARNLPPGGYAVYRVFPAGSADAGKPKRTSDLALGGNFVENGSLKVSYDPRSGNLTSIYDTQLKREFLDAEKGGNLLQAFKDTQNAWEIQMSEPISFDDPAGVEIVEKGPVRVTLKTTRTLKDSIFVQYISLYEGDPLLYGRFDVNWRARNVTTKLAFYLILLNDDAWFEIPYAAISRKAIPTTPSERAKFEVSAQNWVDYTHKDGSAGISLLNNSKYGYDVKENLLRMTLLRSPIKPDPQADLGDHSIEYALYTHGGDWRTADTSRRGYEFNYKPYIIHPSKHEGSLPATHSFYSSAPDNVALTAVKKAEDADGYILRLVETEGRAADAEITLPWTPKKVIETNLIEDEIQMSAPVKLNGGKLTVPLGKYEIKTLNIIM
ncbi:MAG: glycoside hydrolase family 38 C-terminal domain-containing protein [bacterium]